MRRDVPHACVPRRHRCARPARHGPRTRTHPTRPECARPACRFTSGASRSSVLKATAIRAGSAARSNMRRAVLEIWNSIVGAAPRTRSCSAASRSSATDAHDCFARVRLHRARVAALVDTFDAGHCSRSEKVPHLRPVVRRPERKLQHDFVGVGRSDAAATLTPRSRGARPYVCWNV